MGFSPKRPSNTAPSMQGPKITSRQCASNISRRSASSAGSEHSTSKYSVLVPSRSACADVMGGSIGRWPEARQPLHPRGPGGAQPRARVYSGPCMGYMARDELAPAVLMVPNAFSKIGTHLAWRYSAASARLTDGGSPRRPA